MIPREILKKIRQIELRTNILTVALLSAMAVCGCNGAKIPSQTSALPERSAICESRVFSGVVLLSPDDAEELQKHFSPLWNPSTNAVNEATSKIENHLR